MTCTADDVMDGVELSGWTAVVTGVSAGLGAATASYLAAAGARVIGTARDLGKARSVTDVELVEVDLASLASVRTGVTELRALAPRIDLLVNNAGVMATPLQRTADGFELQLGTNHLGHFALTTGLLDLVAGRIVNLSSRGHLRSGMRWEDPHFESTPYDKWLAYGQSKTANVLFTVGLAARGHAAFAVHPGRIFTELPRHLTADDFAELSQRGGPAIPQKTVEEGVATTLWASTSPSLDGRSGLYCEDCHVSDAVAAGPDDVRGHRADAVDPDEAERLWAWSEAQVER